MCKSREQVEWEEELLERSFEEQKAKKDYSYQDDGSIEKCDKCGSFINSHDHCPRCDY